MDVAEDRARLLIVNYDITVERGWHKAPRESKPWVNPAASGVTISRDGARIPALLQRGGSGASVLVIKGVAPDCTDW